MSEDVHAPRTYGGRFFQTMEDKARCVEGVFCDKRRARFQCTRKRGKGPGGLYCGIHNPEARAEKQRLRDAAREAERRRGMRDVQYLIWSNEHRAWWRSNSYGYTRDITDAGYFSREDAMHICACGVGKKSDTPHELPIRLDDAEEFARVHLLPTAGGDK